MSLKFHAIAEVWQLLLEGRRQLDAEVANTRGGAVLYGADGNQCAVGDDFNEDQLKAAVEKAVVVHLGGNVSGTGMAYLVREKKYVPLARAINRGLVGDDRTTFQCFVGPNLEFISHEMPALPKVGFLQVVGKLGDGGFNVAAISLGALLTCFLNALFSGTSPSWAGVATSLVALIIALAIGAAGQFAYKYVATEA
ncbi:MAG: hypothetical protein LBF26_02755 [Puniceicoccales bacterium]|jgi:hypothetical protein|nr:hypothetical protein [Puniceicoccales bacterium]